MTTQLNTLLDAIDLATECATMQALDAEDVTIISDVDDDYIIEW